MSCLLRRLIAIANAAKPYARRKYFHLLWRLDDLGMIELRTDLANKIHGHSRGVHKCIDETRSASPFLPSKLSMCCQEPTTASIASTSRPSPASFSTVGKSESCLPFTSVNGPVLRRAPRHRTTATPNRRGLPCFRPVARQRATHSRSYEAPIPTSADTTPTMPAQGEMGYGMGLLGIRFTGTPNLGFGMSDGGVRDYRIGWRLTPAVEVSLDAMHREAARRRTPCRRVRRWPRRCARRRPRPSGRQRAHSAVSSIPAGDQGVSRPSAAARRSARPG